MREAAACAAEIGRVSKLESKTLLTHTKNRIALHERNTAVRKKSRDMVQAHLVLNEIRGS
jgi:hypothetical protein